MNLQLRWANLENQLGLPQVTTFSAMRTVARFVEGELSYMVLQGAGTAHWRAGTRVFLSSISSGTSPIVE